MKKIFSKSPVFAFLIAFVAFSLHNKEGLRAQGKNSSEDTMKLLADSTFEAQSQIAPVLSKLKKNSDGEFRVPLWMGLDVDDGTKKRYVVREHALVKISGEKLTYLEFYYHRRQEQSLLAEERRIINEEVDDENFTNLKIKYISPLNVEAIYTFSELSRDSTRQKFLVQYRTKIKELVRLLEYHLERQIIREGAGVDKVLSIGEKDE